VSEPPEWFQRVLDAYERDGAEAAWTLYAGGRVVTGEKHAQAILDLLNGSKHVWRRSPGSLLQTEPMMGYPEHAEHFRLLPEDAAEAVLVAARDHDTRQAERDAQIAEHADGINAALVTGEYGRIDSHNKAIRRLLRGGEA